MPEQVTREECQISMARLHQRVDEIRESTIRMEESSKRLEKYGDDMHKLIYGNGQNGMANKITKLFERVSLHTKIIVGTVLAIVGGFVTLVFKLFEK